jgi:hypothetical protein
MNVLLVPLVRPVLRLATWCFRHDAPCIDGVFGALAAAWTWLMVMRPEKFDVGAFVGMSWLPDPAWIAFTATLTIGHAVGLVQLAWRNWRMACALGSSWMWLCVAASFLSVDVSTGVFAYSILGVFALLGAIHVGLLPRRVR